MQDRSPRHEVWASRLPLVLLHGGGPGVDARTNWQAVWPQLSRRFTCLAPDLPGFGSRVPAEDAPLPVGAVAWARERARTVLELLDDVGLERVHLVGNSSAGGAAALALMEVAPDRVDRAVLMGGAGTGPQPARVPFYDEPTVSSMRRTLACLVADEQEQRGLIEELAPVRHRQALRPGAEKAFRSMFARETADVAAVDLASIDRPVLALHGERDGVAPLSVSERLAGDLPQGRLRVIAGAGHWIHVDRPSEFCSAVEEFLSA